ncbi:unnamed protein product [Staurois parvus]|uniref:Uncharacterized protein n=1 Tax=Staurois parvus TaxID=386267 RepID=A0ABN9HCJ0_9NEOB|nr:unnamed protein product [Staurois parvus]
MKHSTHCCANLKVTQSLEVFSYCLCRQLVTSAHCALQNALTPLCHFYVAELLLLPLCYNTTNR